jgi:phage tail sheath protein FI
MIQGYSIPYALNHIQLQTQNGKQQIGQVIAVNVFDPSVHNTTVTSLPLTMPASGTQYVNVGFMGLVGPGLNGYTGATTVVVRNSSGSVTYVENTDYTVDYINGLIYTKSGGAITTGESLLVSFAYCDPSKVQDTDLIGTASGSVYSGMQVFLTCMSLFGVTPRILIAPGYGGGGTYAGSKDQDVAAAMLAVAGTLSGFALIDSSPNTSVSSILSQRSNSADAFDTANYRAILCFPCQNYTDQGYVPTGTVINTAGAVVNTVSNATVDGPYSAWVAGAWSNQIVNNGFWWSLSNVVLNGPLGPDITMYMSYTDPNSDDNTLNAAGIVTVMNVFGSGLRTWGNRSSAFPTYTDVRTFTSIRMALDIVEMSIQKASLQFIDAPITTGMINSVLTSCNGFIRSIIQQGGLLSGSTVSYNPGDNPPLSLSAGVVTFEVSLMPPPPAENIVYNFVVNTALLANTGPAQASSALTMS